MTDKYREQAQRKSPEIREATTEEDVQHFFAFADPILGVDWGESVPMRYSPEYIPSHPDMTKVFFIRDTNKGIIAGGKVGLLTPEDQQRLQLKTDRPGALLEYAAVREEDRRRGLLTELTRIRIN